METLRKQIIAIAVAAFVILTATASALAQQDKSGVKVDGDKVTVLVTVHPHSSSKRAAAASIQPGDFAVREDDRPQEILSVRQATQAPLHLAVLIQDDLISRVNNELRGVKEFIRGLPQGSRVMVGYLTTGSLAVAQEFTTDLEKAAKEVRVVRSSTAGSPFNPYVGLLDALRRFDAEAEGRKVVLMISDGLDISRGFSSASPSQSIDLDRAIRAAQRRGVAVFTFYSPSVGLTSFNRLAVNFGQGSLNRLADETGGQAFFSGTSFVSFAPYFRELNELLGQQWLITYRSTNTGDDFRRIKITTEQDVHLHYPEGYRPRNGDK